MTGAPHNVSIFVLSPYQLWVSWDHPPLSERDGDITGYVLYVVETASGSESEINVSATTSHTLESLHPYYMYMIKVATVTERGQGQFSSAVSARTYMAGKEGWVGGEGGGRRGKEERGGRRRLGGINRKRPQRNSNFINHQYLI